MWFIFQEDFKYGEYDGHHTYHEGEDKGILTLNLYIKK